MKLGVIVPYRKRESQLKQFRKEITEYLTKKKIKFELLIVEQSDNKPFNRGKLLNIGFQYAKKMGCDYVAFHDIDMLPVNVDYSYTDFPIHLATNFEFNPTTNRIVFDEYFGGVTLFPIEAFEKINGYSNEYWGWGFEDDDLLWRCKNFNIGIETKAIVKDTIYEKGMYFNGKSSYIECETLKNMISFREARTVLVTFKSDDIVLNPNKEYDDYTIFSIPGYDLNISYNSYKRYKVEAWSEKLEPHSINTDILPNTYTTIAFCLDFENKKISMYKDGKFIGEKMIGYKYMKDGIEEFRQIKIYKHSNEESFYIGCGNPIRQENPNYFKGTITNFAIFDGVLNGLEIESLYENKILPLTKNFKKYKSADKLLCYYDMNFVKEDKLTDLSFNNNDAKMVNIHHSILKIDNTEQTVVPKRRKSLFKLLPHKENGYVDGKWKNKATRINQIKFFKILETNSLENEIDGLSTCIFKEISFVSDKNYHFISTLL